MEIRCLGGQSFLIEGKEASVLTAPVEAKARADIVLSPKLLPSENGYPLPKEGEPFLIPGPGEYEIKGVKIRGFVANKTPFYLIQMEKISIAFLNGLTRALSDEEINKLGLVDILLTPTAGGGDFGPGKAAEMITQLEPKIIIPIASDKVSLETFLKELGEEPKHEKTLEVSREKLPEELEVMVIGSM